MPHLDTGALCVEHCASNVDMDKYALTVYIFLCTVLCPPVQEMCVLGSLFQDSELKFIFLSAPMFCSFLWVDVQHDPIICILSL
jgi:hypothetical protein